MQYESLKLDKISGALAGMVLGDAFGVPGELWPREKIVGRFGRITEFLDGPQDNIVACYFKAGHYTDDSSQALVILKDLLKHQRVPAKQVIAQDLIEWVKSVNGFEINLLGPSSKAALLAIAEGKEADSPASALTNGAAMRIAPVGCFFEPDELKLLCQCVKDVSCVTHDTDVTIGGAAMVAAAVSYAIAGRSWDEMAKGALEAYDYAKVLGHQTWAASCKERFKLALDVIKTRPDEDKFSMWVYEVLGTGTMTSESVSAALAIAFYCQDPHKAALMCANLGGDTDTIGAMACAICGAYSGLSGFDQKTVEYLQTTNQIDFAALGRQIIDALPSFYKEPYHG